ncbi:MAG: MBL fold metallo-hydrolase [Candidatus Didemnitutus sp.]|nr:MBL fold metallo-hydrolase [Candidatus Didemnitutus sp.]
MNRRDFLVTGTAAVSWGCLAGGKVFGQVAAPTPATPPPLRVQFTPLRRGVGIFTARGGTIGWLANADALVVVDTQFADAATRFLQEWPEREGRLIDAVINTHHHGDHTGGNATMRPFARQLVAHEAVPALQLAAAARNPNAPAPTVAEALFAESWKMDAGDETVSARYFGPAHTGGDIVVHCERANVVHLGDLVFNRTYPVTDRAGGCRVRSWIQVLETIATTYSADTLFVLGHGKPAFGVTGTTADVLVMRDFLTAVVEQVEADLRDGKSKAEIVTRQNFDQFPDFRVEQNSRLPINLGVVYDELTNAT